MENYGNKFVMRLKKMKIFKNFFEKNKVVLYTILYKFVLFICRISTETC